MTKPIGKPLTDAWIDALNQKFIESGEKTADSAKKIGISREAFSAIRNQRNRTPSARTLALISKHYGMPLPGRKEKRLPAHSDNWFKGKAGKIRKICFERLYRWNDCFADEIRIFGVGKETFPPERIEAVLEEKPYQLPKELSRNREKEIPDIEAWARSNNMRLYDGECVHLKNVRAILKNNLEENHLELTFAKMSWYDYILANQRFDEPEIESIFREKFDPLSFVSIEDIRDQQDLRASKLTNIVTAYVTCTTQDGFLIYVQRPLHMATQKGKLISSVSENANPSPAKDYLEGGFLNELIFRTAARGIEEELSPKLKPNKPAKSLLCLGIGYHLNVFHSGFLFLMPVPFRAVRVRKFLLENPGRDYAEGSAHFVHLDDEQELKNLLRKGNWFPGGHASIIRSLQFLDVRGGLRSEAAEELSEHKL